MLQCGIIDPILIWIMIFGKENKLEDSWSRAASYESVKMDQSIPHYKEMLDLPFQQALMFTYKDITLQQDFFVYSIPIYDPLGDGITTRF
ncbi:hypothetical protein LJR056_001824 [Paenibacillus sp. LjRoot56]